MCKYCNGQIAKEVNEKSKIMESLLNTDDYKYWQQNAIGKMCRNIAFNIANEHSFLSYYVDPDIKVLIFRDGNTFVPIKYCPNCGRKLRKKEP